MFLTIDQLEELTGLKQFAAQKRWLARQRLPFRVRADGRPIVMVADVVSNASTPAARPRFDAVQRPR